MIRIENERIAGSVDAMRGMRNPMNSWDKHDSYTGEDFREQIGTQDLKLAQKLASQGSVHAKYRRMIIVWIDVTAPLYWWKEFDTYKIGTVTNSCSTMHTIHKREFTINDFSHEHLIDYTNPCLEWGDRVSLTALESTIGVMNFYRKKFLKTKNKDYWWQIIQLLPSSYNQMRTIMLNYEVLANIYHSRKEHKLDEWREFCFWIETLPYAEEMILS